MTNYVFIGDVHSQFSKFSTAVQWVKDNVIDYHIIQGGDLFDSRTEESQSVEVYQLVKELGDRITVINSNHLYKMHRVLTGASTEYGESLQRTLEDFKYSSFSNQELIDWLETLPFGIAFKDSFGEEYRVAHAYWFSKLYVPEVYAGIYSVKTISSKAKGQMLYGLKRKEENERLLWWEFPHSHSFVRVAFHYHTISLDKKGVNGNKHLVLDGCCGDDGGVLAVYNVNREEMVTF